MDKSEKQPKMSEYQQDLINNADIDEERIKKQYVEENGNLYRVPYRIVAKVVFSGIDKACFKDPEHAARLQYRLMLNDAILKARVYYIRGSITIIYNPPNADNMKEKISIDEIIKSLENEGVKVSREHMANGDYDYYKNFYSYAFNSPSIREHAPYGYTLQEWKKLKPQWEKNKAESKRKSEEKFRNFQAQYLEAHPELAKEYGIELKEEKRTEGKLFGKKKK